METIDKKKFFELHKLLVQTTIDFLKDQQVINPNEIWDLTFSVDGLPDSVDKGKWMPTTDSSLCIRGIDQNTIYHSI